MGSSALYFLFFLSKEGRPGRPIVVILLGHDHRCTYPLAGSRTGRA
jgi:hypothetical protein